MTGSANPTRSVRVLSIHAGYRCGHSGACCTSGWPIPVEAPLRRRLGEAIADGRVALPGGGETAFVERPDAPAGYAALLHVTPSGACACYDSQRRRCAIHSGLGHEWLPVSCQHFPRIALVEQGAAFVTLSHYCPTAAGLLFRSGTSPVVVEAPPGFAPMPLEGLDARDALPPLLHPTMLMDSAGYHRWEAAMVRLLGRGSTPESSLSRAIGATEALRGWTPARGPLGEAVNAAFEAGTVPVPDRQRRAALGAAALAVDRLVRQSVPAGLEAASAPANASDVFAELVAPRWFGFAAPVGRYLAARAYANWLAYQGRGLRTITCSLVAALSVLKVESARCCARADRSLDREILLQALRATDLVLVHLASREELARRLGAIEEAQPADLLGAL